MAMKISKETIKPEQAQAYLREMETNRPLSKAAIDEYARKMKEGKWDYENGDTICFNGSALVDGQHRLHACIKSNIPLKTIVVRGVSDTAFSHKDIGRKRSGGDTLAIEGYKNHNVLAAAARIVYTYENGISFGKHPKIDNADTLDVVARHPGLEEWCRRSNAAKKNLLIPAGPAAGFFYLFSLSNEAKAEDFFDDFTKGEGLQKGDPALALRNQLIRATRTPGSSPFVGYEGRQYMAGAMICTWNAIKRGEKREVIRVPKKAMFKIK